MELQLINFRSVSNKTFSFDSGVHLLEGESGVGKSTCLEAVQWVLYGGSNVYPFDYDKKKKEFTQVILKIDSLTIHRTKPPDRILVIVDEDTELLHTEAQKYIDNYFGSKTFWESSYYLKQDCRNLLLFGTKEEKNNIVREIVFGSESGDNTPDKYLQRVEESLKELETQVFSKKELSTYLATSLESKLSEISLTGSQIKRCEKLYLKRPDIEQKLDHIKFRIKQREQNERRKLRKIQINLELKDYPSLTLQFMEKWKNWLSATKEIGGMKVSDIHDLEVGNLDKLKKEIYELERKRNIFYPNKEKLSSINSKLQYDKKCINTEIERLESKKIDIVKYQNYLEKRGSVIKIVDKIKAINLKISKFETSLSEIGDIEDLEQIREKLLEMKTNLMKCPKCNKKLILSEGVLKEGKGTPISKQRLSKYQKEFQRLQEYHQWKQELNSVKDLYSTMKLPTPVKEPSEENCDKLLSLLKRIEVVDFDEKKYQFQKKMLDNSETYQKYLDLKNKIENNYIPGIEKIKVPFNLDEYYQSYQSLKQELKVLESQTLKDDGVELLEKEKRGDELLEMLDMYEDYLELEQESSKLEKINLEINEMLKKRESFCKLKKIIQEESNVTFENLMVSFNSILNDIVSEIFEDIYIEIGMFKKNKTKGDIKPQFNMKVILKGNEYDNLNFLSGGEKDRVSMALMITLAKLGRGNVVMLDETMSSLGEEMRQEMLTLIKKHLTDKIVLVVCHSTVEGFYDSVVSF